MGVIIKPHYPSSKFIFHSLGTKAYLLNLKEKKCIMVELIVLKLQELWM